MNNCLRIKDVFKSYVDDDDFIFKRISPNKNVLVNKFDWFSLDNNDVILLSLDDYSLLYGPAYDASSSANSYYYYDGYLLARNSTGTQTSNCYMCLCYDKTNSSNKYFVFGLCSTNTGSLISTFTTHYTINDIIIIDEKRYLPISWEQVRFFYAYTYFGGSNTRILNTLLDNSGYYIQEQLPSYDWYTSTLDFEYLYSHSGDKFISPLVQKLLEDDNTITTLNLEKLVNVIKNKYIDKWNRLFDVLSEDYNALENYNMYEKETPNITKDKHTETNVEITVSGGGSSQSNVFGFNTTSEDGVPNAIASADNSSTTSGETKDNYSDVTDTETGTRELERNGNIGVTSSQQLLEQELEVRKHNIYELMYEDVDSLLTLDIY